MARPTIRDVAARAGVSLGTASRALSGNGSVRPATREAVLQAAKDLDYRVNSLARSLRSNHTASIGLLIPDVRNPYFSQLAHVVEQSALEHGVTTLLCNADERPEQMAMYVDVLRERRVDGVIVSPFADAEQALAGLDDDAIPTVFIDRRIPDSPTPSVTSDTGSALDEAIALMSRLGHRRVGFITGPRTTSTGIERIEQVAAAADHHGVEVEWQEGDFHPESGHRAATSLLGSGTRAILASDAQTTEGALSAIVEQGVTLGEGLHFIGFDGTPATALIRPSLTYVRQQVQEMAATAVDLLVRLRAGEIVTSVRLPSTLVLGGSARPAADHLTEERSCA
ncbi:LacI family DNA-binding transcriptional regulator [Brachybacterium epidermidis]|uniref:LacI family DNA-binding transcriptional regulator n=1 Tax=Brachybacterium epidermidis TaxID=2781983 RepID=UPI00398E343C